MRSPRAAPPISPRRSPVAGLLALVLALACGTAAAQQGPVADPGKPAPAPAAPGASGPGDQGAPAPAPTPGPDEPRCGWCKTTGKVPFDVSPKFAVEADSGPGWKVEFCSEALASENMAIPWEPCERCKSPTLKAAAVAEYEKLKQANEAWLAGVRKLDKASQVEQPLVHVRSTHFWIATDVPKITGDDKKTYKTHEMAHLYVRRMEALYARIESMFGIQPNENMRNVHFIFMFEKQAPAFRAAPVYTGLSIENAVSVKRTGGQDKDSVIVTWWDRSMFPKDQDMHRHQIHNMVHLLTAIYYDYNWFQPGEHGLSPPWLNDKYGWLDEGLAHWFEIDFDKKAATYCFREQDSTSRWGGDDWRANIYKAVVAGDRPSFSDVSAKPSQSLSAKEHQFSWSWVDYLMAQDPAAMGKAIRLCKLEKPSREILKEAWNINLLTFEQDWAQWVEDHYAPTAKR